MFDTILVPLDESENSRAILPALEGLLRREDARVHLLRVVVPLLERPSEREGRADTGERHLALRRQEALRHLEELATALSAEGVDVSAEVALGDPAGAILDRIERDPPALVAMSTHGRRGPARWIRGSVAERVLRRCPAPLLLVNPRTTEHRRFQRILVPLDGSDLSDRILPAATAFAALHGSTVTLLRVKDLPVGDYAAPAVLIAQRLDDVDAFLAERRERLVEQGLTVEVRSALGDPATEILDLVEREGIDLVAMTTHGATGLDRWLFGSVAEHVLRVCPAPVLVKREPPSA